jgi:hypothetical protein
MAASVRNIIVGAAQVFVSANVGTTGDPVATIPTLQNSTSAATTVAASGSWRDVGYTTNGLELSYEPDFGEIAVDQLLDAARLFKQGQKVMLKTEFAEATLENLFVVMNQTSGYNTDNAKKESGTTINGTTINAIEIQGGTLGDYPVERSLIAVGPGPRPTSGNSERVYYAARAMSMDASAHGLKRDSGTFFPVSFRLLPVASTSNAYGKIIDRSY